MDLERFEQFKRESDILIQTSIWLVKEMDKVIEEEFFYDDNPHLDSHEMMDDRIRAMEELQQKCEWEQNAQNIHYQKYIDIINSDIL